MRDKVSQLHEQGAVDSHNEKYVRRWWQWVKGGVYGLVYLLGFVPQPYLLAATQLKAKALKWLSTMIAPFSTFAFSAIELMVASLVV
jgi:hypothetical protein